MRYFDGKPGINIGYAGRHEYSDDGTSMGDKS